MAFFLVNSVALVAPSSNQLQKSFFEQFLLEKFLKITLILQFLLLKVKYRNFERDWENKQHKEGLKQKKIEFCGFFRCNKCFHHKKTEVDEANFAFSSSKPLHTCFVKRI